VAPGPDGPRVEGGLRAAAWAAVAARARRGERIWSITDGCVMHATIRMAPWQAGRAGGSTSKICWSSAAQQRRPRSARFVARRQSRAARPPPQAQPSPACHAGGWHTSRSTAWSRGPCPGCAPAPGPGTRAGPRSRGPPPGLRICPTDRSPTSRPGRTSVGPARRDSARSSAEPSGEGAIVFGYPDGRMDVEARVRPGEPADGLLLVEQVQAHEAPEHGTAKRFGQARRVVGGPRDERPIRPEAAIGDEQVQVRMPVGARAGVCRQATMPTVSARSARGRRTRETCRPPARRPGATGQTRGRSARRRPAVQMIRHQSKQRRGLRASRVVEAARRGRRVGHRRSGRWKRRAYVPLAHGPSPFRCATGRFHATSGVAGRTVLAADGRWEARCDREPIGPADTVPFDHLSLPEDRRRSLNHDQLHRKHHLAGRMQNGARPSLADSHPRATLARNRSATCRVLGFRHPALLRTDLKRKLQNSAAWGSFIRHSPNCSIVTLRTREPATGDVFKLSRRASKSHDWIAGAWDGGRF